ncbi:MAG TPA: L,D-transpeptidase family protein [Micavibrio sp.]
MTKKILFCRDDMKAGKAKDLDSSRLRGLAAGRILPLALILSIMVCAPASAEIIKPPSSRVIKEEPASKGQAKAYAKDYIGEMQSYVAKYEDTMVQIARTYNVGFVELRSANPFLDPWIPGAGKKLIIPSMHLLPRSVHEGVVINLPEMRMYAYIKPGNPPITFPIGIGREGLLTPSGSTSIVRKKEGPVWRPTLRMRKEHPELPVQVGPGPDNPMGTHAMYLGWPEYAIHGTDKPFSIGRRVSSGCIRMYPEDIIKAYNLFPVGTRVTVVDQPVKVGWVGDRLYLEAHPTTDQADKMELDGGLPGYVFTEEDMGLIVAAAGEYTRDLDWRLIREAIRERRGYPVEVFRHAANSAENPALEKAPVVLGQSAESPSGAQPEKTADTSELTEDSAVGATPN